MAKPSEMSQNSKREYLEKMKWRYERRGREGRSVLLDELCEVCGYSRKHAIKLMNGSLAKNSKPRGRRAVYGAAELAVIKPIWLAGQPALRQTARTAAADLARALGSGERSDRARDAGPP